MDLLEQILFDLFRKTFIFAASTADIQEVDCFFLLWGTDIWLLEIINVYLSLPTRVSAHKSGRYFDI